MVQVYITASIAEAVTGKIDVRNYAIPVFIKDEEELDMIVEDGEELQ